MHVIGTALKDMRSQTVPAYIAQNGYPRFRGALPLPGHEQYTETMLDNDEYHIEKTFINLMYHKQQFASVLLLLLSVTVITHLPTFALVNTKSPMPPENTPQCVGSGNPLAQGGRSIV